MKSKRRGKGLATALLVGVVSTAMLMLMAGIPASASAHPTAAPLGMNWGHHSIVVRPNGHNDTSNIQSAFNRCVTFGAWCTVQLVRGTYYTDQITVSGFEGSFVGAGQGRTTVQALPNLPSPSVTPYWSVLPGSSNPWPELFTFVGGTIGISGMTFSVPYANPTQGWTLPTNTGVNGGNYTALESAVMITGLTAFASVDRVTIVGGAGDGGGYNLLIGVDFQGKLLPSVWSNPYADALPVTGALAATSNMMESVFIGVQVVNIADASASVCHSSFTNVAASYLEEDVSNSQMLVCGNYAMGSEDYAAVVAAQSEIKTNLLPSTLYVVGNDLMATGGANDIGGLDYGPSDSPAVAATLTVVAIGNVLTLNTSCGCYPANNPFFSDALDYSLSSFVFSGNTVNGSGTEPGVYVFGGPAAVSANQIVSATTGVWIDYANNVSVVRNLVQNSVEYGIAVTDGSSYNMIARNYVANSGLYDLYWDQTGTGDLWWGNTYTTSSPTTLP